MNLNETSELHIFVDVCNGTFAAFVFDRSDLGSESKVTLIRAKNRLATVKPLIIPRLEFVACCIEAKLVNTLQGRSVWRALKSHSGSYSIVALWWIKEFGEWSVFVANRVKHIRELTGFFHGDMYQEI
ncbi:uncharacterized protein NPIL_474221 [Nephila pilipes]|uniref:Uncharacterized protein n=1 Tax=Nephila pilipes TaxID=299642 RepID=A0A8X6QIL5_NEPPI|nr:uncharacterized protein NPIL_474221 [Nephila pilipes]